MRVKARVRTFDSIVREVRSNNITILIDLKTGSIGIEIRQKSWTDLNTDNSMAITGRRLGNGCLRYYILLIFLMLLTFQVHIRISEYLCSAKM